MSMPVAFTIPKDAGQITVPVFFQVGLYEIPTLANVKHAPALLCLWLDAAKLGMLRVIYKKQPLLASSSAAQR